VLQIPAQERHRQGQGSRGDQGAHAAGRHDGGVDRGLPSGVEPLAEDLEGGHQAGGDAEADERTAERQLDQRVARGEHTAPGCGDEQQHGLHAARAEPVERDTERQLGRCEGKEVRAGQEPQAAG
jgi:hypothetical protein